MASYHCTLKSRTRDTAKSPTVAKDHFEYIYREGKYESRAHEIENIGNGNLPEWAKSQNEFWEASDNYERVNGRVYQELVIALPNELTKEQRNELTKELCDKLFANENTYSYAIHNTEAALTKGVKNSHVHIMFTDRVNDKISRTKEKHFMRTNNKEPEKGGAPKDRKWHDKEKISEIRQLNTKIQNKYLERYGHEQRIDDRSLLAQKTDAILNGNFEKAIQLDRDPEKHIGPSAHKNVREIEKILTKAHGDKRKFTTEKEKYYDNKTGPSSRTYIERQHERYMNALRTRETNEQEEQLKNIKPDKHKQYYKAQQHYHYLFKVKNVYKKFIEENNAKTLTDEQIYKMAEAVVKRNIENKGKIFIADDYTKKYINRVAEGMTKKNQPHRDLQKALQEGQLILDKHFEKAKAQLENHGKEIDIETKQNYSRAAKHTRQKYETTHGSMRANLRENEDIAKAVTDYSLDR